MNKLLLCLLGTPLLVLANETPLFSIIPQGSLPTTVTPTGTATALYTVTNNSPYTLTGLGLGPLTPAGVTQSTSGTNTPMTCLNNFNLKPGQACTLVLTITGSLLQNGGAFGGPEVCFNMNTPSRCSVPSEGNQLNVQAVPPVVLASGFSGNSTPLLIQTMDEGLTWNLSNLPTVPSSEIGYPSCSIGFCVAIVAPGASNSYLVYTTNNGLSWQYLSSISFVTDGNIQNDNGSTACTQDPLGMCLVWGLDTALDTFISVQYTASIPTWTVVDIFAPFGNPSLGQAACGSSFCVVGGQDGPVGFVFQSLDASTWSPVTSFTGGPSGTLPPQSALHAVGCDGDFCVYFGQNQTGSLPHNLFIVTTSDGGNTWTYRDLTMGDSQTVASVSCNEAAGLCAALAYLGSTAYGYTTVDGGVTWTQHTFPGASSLRFGSVSCNQYLCLAATTASVDIFQFTPSGGWTNLTVPVAGGTSPSPFMVNCFDQYCIVGGTFVNSLSQNEVLLVQAYNAGPGTPTFQFVDLSLDPSIPLINSVIQWGGSSVPVLKSSHTELDYFKMK